MQQVKINIRQNNSTQFKQLDALRDFLTNSRKFARLSRSAKRKILADIDAFVGAGREQGSLQGATQNVMMLGAPPAPGELEERIVANLEKVPEHFGLTPRNIYEFLGMTNEAGMRTSYRNMKAIIDRKVQSLKGVSAEDIRWLKRQLEFMLTSEAEKTALDAFLGDTDELARLQSAVEIDDQVKDDQVQNFIAIQELLQGAQKTIATR